jgi:hypothetical protein
MRVPAQAFTARQHPAYQQEVVFVFFVEQTWLRGNKRKLIFYSQLPTAIRAPPRRETSVQLNCSRRRGGGWGRGSGSPPPCLHLPAVGLFIHPAGVVNIPPPSPQPNAVDNTTKHKTTGYSGQHSFMTRRQHCFWGLFCQFLKDHVIICQEIFGLSELKY